MRPEYVVLTPLHNLKKTFSRIFIILLLVSIAGGFNAGPAYAWSRIGTCKSTPTLWAGAMNYDSVKDKYNSRDFSKLNQTTRVSLSNQWQALTGEQNILLQKGSGLENYCKKLKSKADATSDDVDRLNNECDNKNWDLAAYSHCASWKKRVDDAKTARQNEADEFDKVLIPYISRFRKLAKELSAFSEQLDKAECEGMYDDFLSHQHKFQALKGKIKDVQDKINIQRKIISETKEIPISDESGEDFANCESTAYEMISSTSGGIHCTLWETGSWFMANPLLGRAKVEKYYLEVDLLKLDRQIKKTSREWEMQFGKYLARTFNSDLKCTQLKTMSVLK